MSQASATSIAFLFPGQGSQAVGMGKTLAEAHPAAAQLLQQANEILGYDLRHIMFEGPEENLRQTKHTQPALFVASCAAATVLAQAEAVRPAAVAGHSIGEYAALVAAGALGFEAALRLVQARAEAMQRANDAGGGAMVAVLGLADADCECLCAEHGAGQVVVANYNSPGQVVISGASDAVAQVAAAAKAAGAKRTMPLAVSGAFHSPLMEQAAAELAEHIRAAEFADALVPVVTNVDALPHTAAKELRANLLVQMRSSVRWTASVLALRDACGCGTFIEVGTGKVLKGLMGRIAPEAAVRGVGEASDLQPAG